MTSVLIAADDLSGAADAALPFATARSALVTSNPGVVSRDLPQPGVVSLDMATRHASAEAAYTTMYRVAQGARGRDLHLYKKVDSRLKGNPGTELAAIVDAWPEAVVIATPCLPSMRRTVRGGWLCEGTRAVPTRSVVEVLAADGAIKIEHAPRSTLLDTQSLCAKVAAAPAGTVVVGDAENDGDLADWVKVGLSLRRPVVWLGSAGLASHLARRLEKPTLDVSNAHSPADQSGRRGVIVVVGSLERVVHRQIKAIMESLRPVVCQLEQARSQQEEWLQGGLGGLTRQLTMGGVVLLTATEEDGLRDPVQVSDDPRFADQLAGVAARLRAMMVDAGNPGPDLVATGGETARAVLHALAEESCWIVGQVEPQVPLMLTQREGIGLVTKSGSFGTPYSLVRAVDSLRAWRSGLRSRLSRA